MMNKKYQRVSFKMIFKMSLKRKKKYGSVKIINLNRKSRYKMTAPCKHKVKQKTKIINKKKRKKRKYLWEPRKI